MECASAFLLLTGFFDHEAIMTLCVKHLSVLHDHDLSQDSCNLNFQTHKLDIASSFMKFLTSPGVPLPIAS